MYHMQAREKRRQRKIYLKNKRSKKIKTTSNVPSTSLQYLFKNTVILFYTYIYKFYNLFLFADQSINIVRQTQNVNTFTTPLKHNTTIQYCPSFTDVRTPFSNITNVINPLSNNRNDIISFDKYTTSKLANKRQYHVLSNEMTSKNASTVTTSSSSIKLNPGCHKLRTKTRHLSLIPLIDLTEDNIWIMVIKLLYVKHVVQSYGEMNPLEVKKRETRIIHYVVVTAKFNFQI
uniref:Uncharacterized protein n=1 Tax=Lactuca sativa TaxID=4236 RepID=A0A9R1XVP5_LACSA|nr:hypothetical protein LSAT_V11C100011060 [Lactuca sativa]